MISVQALRVKIACAGFDLAVTLRGDIQADFPLQLLVFDLVFDLVDFRILHSESSPAIDPTSGQFLKRCVYQMRSGEHHLELGHLV